MLRPSTKLNKILYHRRYITEIFLPVVQKVAVDTIELWCSPYSLALDHLDRVARSIAQLSSRH